VFLLKVLKNKVFLLKHLSLLISLNASPNKRCQNVRADSPGWKSGLVYLHPIPKKVQGTCPKFAVEEVIISNTK
jgi:hypothetical protein